MPKVRVDGIWPEPVVLRRGWSRAESRPWNAVTPMAHLRMVRGGGPSFICDCVDALVEFGASAVLSPPLPRSAQATWMEADFERHADLTLMRRQLDHIRPPGHIVAVGDEDDLDEALLIDAAAFDDFWRFDRRAMIEAMQSTAVSVVHVARTGEGLAGFAITGVGRTLAYLQRVAVDPRWQGQGIGRSLVRTSARWAKKQGAQALMLNTQASNEPAISLYANEGFLSLDEPLAVLKSA